MSMLEVSSRNKANQEVAELVATALRSRKLLSEPNLQDLPRKLASGSIKATDWKLMFMMEVKNSNGKDKG